MEKLVSALLDGDQDLALLEVDRLREAHVPPQEIITHGVEAAMAQLDAKCTVEQFNLLEIMLCGRAAIGVMRKLYPPGSPQPPTRGAVVIAALEGDIHDLGKNIFKMLLSATGFRPVDCGKDCPLDRLVDTAQQEGALAVGVSGLITLVLPQVQQVRLRLAERGLGHVHVLAGGAALKQATAESLKVDFVAQSAFEGIHFLNQVVEGPHEQS